MTPVEIGIAGVILLFVLFLLKVHIAFSMAITGFVGFCYITTVSAGQAMLVREVYAQFYNYSLCAITLFVLMGTFAFVAGIGERLFNSAHKIVGDLRGGMGMATVIGCAGFAAICGSTNATAATIGRIAIPEMRKYKYNDVLAAGIVASGGTLGILIPPSTVFIVYGFLTDQSIGKLFVAGVLPGIMLSVLMGFTIWLICRINPAMGPPSEEKISIKDKFKALVGVLDALILFALVIGGMFLGWFSPIEGAGIGAFATIIIGLLHRQITWPNFVYYLKDGLRTAGMIVCIITGATIFGRFFAVTTIPFKIAGWVGSLPLSPSMIAVVIMIICLIGGCFIDSMALITLIVPVIFPVIISLGLDPIWFGVIIVLVSQMGVITPPVGTNVYVVKGLVPNVPLAQIFKGSYPFLAAIVVATLLVIAFPQIALFLPSFSQF